MSSNKDNEKKIQEQLLKINKLSDNFPSAEEVLLKRLKAKGITDKASLKQINAKSIACIAIQSEIDITKSMLATVTAQLPLLLVPVTIKPAIQLLNAQLPYTIKMLNNLGVKIPDSIIVLIDTIEAAKNILTAASITISAPPLTPLKKIIGI